MVASVTVLSVAAVAISLLRRGVLEIEVTDVAMLLDAPQVGRTQLHARLVLRNIGPSPVSLQWLTLFANEPITGSQFDTFVHIDPRLEPGETISFSEVANVTGHWSEVAFTVKVFPVGAPTWDSPLVPEQSVTWTSR